ncbi:MAG TPA: T9SS type A sorting domain-containing protein [Chitinophagales bacterium]|nr:T9SS type A sorting domain-containing protein [Chitinophagales bacterium]HRX23787.1 T9SS type A sorting domain-containing protein [Chitinophagales bacterium]
MKQLLIIVLISCFTATYAQWPTVSIHDLQFRDEASLVAEDDLSLYDGDTVMVQGIVIFDPCTYALSTSGSRIGTFLVDETETGEWTGLHVLIDPGASGYGGTLEELNDATLFIDNFQVGNVVECAGIIGTFDENTQIVLIDEPSSIIGFSSVPDPEVLGIDVFSTSDGGGGQIQETVTGEAYEGVYVQFNNVFVVDVAPFGDFRWTWYLQDADGNKIQIRDASGFYRNDTNTDDECSIWSGGAAGETATPDEFTPPTTGTYLEYVRGVIMEAYGGTAYSLAPLTPGDVGPELASPPSVTNINRDPYVPTSTESVTVTATITDIDGTVAGASLNYSYGYGSTAWSSADMINTAGDTWEASIPGPGVDGEYVNFYIYAEDADGNSIETPGSVSPVIYQVFDDGIQHIVQIQYTPAASGTSIWVSDHAFNMDIEAVVMASRQTYDLGWLIVQDDDSPWSGIRIYSQPGDGTTELLRGDKIRITSAMVREDFGATLLDSVTITVIGTEDLYEPVTGLDPESINAQVFDQAEAYESMFIRFEDVYTTSNNPDAPGGPFGEWRFNTDNVAGTGLRADDLSYEVPFEFAADSVTVGEPMDWIQGILTYSFSNFKLEPRDLNDIAGFSTEYPNKITAFSFDGLGATGTIDQDAQTITVEVPSGTDVSSLSPTVTITGVTLDPPSGTTQDFSSPVTYTCYAPVSGTGRAYEVTVTMVDALSDLIDNQYLVVYPNPVSDNMTVQFTAKESGEAVLVMQDISGNNLLKMNLLYTVGKNISELDLRSFPNGLYLLQIQTSSGSVTQKIEVSR